MKKRHSLRQRCHQVSVTNQHDTRLCQAGQGFVGALDDHICPQGQRRRRRDSARKMSAMGSVNNGRQPCFAGHRKKRLILPGDAVISRVHHEQVAAVGMGGNGGREILRRHAQGNAQRIVKTHRQRHCFSACQHQSLVHAAMGMTRHKYLAPAAKGEQRRLDAQRGAAQQILYMRTAACCRPACHGIGERAFGMRQVVQARNFCHVIAPYVAAPGVAERLRHEPPVFMARGVKACGLTTDHRLQGLPKRSVHRVNPFLCDNLQKTRWNTCDDYLIVL